MKGLGLGRGQAGARGKENTALGLCTSVQLLPAWEAVGNNPAAGLQRCPHWSHIQTSAQKQPGLGEEADKEEGE